MVVVVVLSSWALNSCVWSISISSNDKKNNMSNDGSRFDVCFTAEVIYLKSFNNASGVLGVVLVVLV